MQHSRKFTLLGHTVEAPPLQPGLYIVSTPIGNLGDITLRALQVLAAAEMIAAEDTRVSRVLLDRYGIATRPVAYHDHNAEAAEPRLVAALAEGRSVALISDAGTPLVSDPGYRLVRRAIAEGFAIVPVPGASAILAALAGAGLPTDSFHFGGFLPPRGAARRRRLEEVAPIAATLVFYESPRRLAQSLVDMAEVLGPAREAAVARELTKHFEEFRRGRLEELAGFYRDAPEPKGEIVVVVGPPVTVRQDLDVDLLLRRLAGEMTASRAAAEAARLTGLSRRELYLRLLQRPAQEGKGE